MREADAVKIAKCLSDPTRHRMLREIRAAGEMTCTDVCDRFPLSQPTISHHVKLLKACGLVTAREEGPFHVLSVNERALRDFARRIAGPAQAPRATRKPRPRSPARRA